MVTEAVLGIVLLGHAAAAWAMPIVAWQWALLPRLDSSKIMHE